MDLGLQGKHAIVTGGSRGIGKAIARELAREGVDVAIVARNQRDLEATARELGTETNRRIVPLAADVTSKEQVDRMVAEAAQQLGGVHILINSGSAPGGSPTATGPIDTVVDEDLVEDFNTKYVGALRCSRAVIPFMKTAGWGRIINISGGNARNAGNLSGGARASSSRISSARRRRRRTSAGAAMARSTSICASSRASTIASGRSGWSR
jgi:NAD(P)-dependent dehydrogenase (short-subunit alcohol dehydrogenase family)